MKSNHKLYKDGAKIAYNILDILEDFDDIFSNDEDYVKMKLKYFEGGNINKNIKVKKVNKVNDVKENNKVSKQEKKLDKKENNKQNKKQNGKIKDVVLKQNLQDDEAIIYDIISEVNGFIKQLSGKYYSIEK